LTAKAHCKLFAGKIAKYLLKRKGGQLKEREMKGRMLQKEEELSKGGIEFDL